MSYFLFLLMKVKAFEVEARDLKFTSFIMKVNYPFQLIIPLYFLMKTIMITIMKEEVKLD